MSEDTIKTKKKDKSTWKSLGLAVAAVGGLAITIAKELNKTIGSFSSDSLSADFYMNKKLTVKRIDEIQNILNDVFSQKCSITNR